MLVAIKKIPWFGSKFDVTNEFYFLYLKSWLYFALEVGQHILHSKKQKPGVAEHLWTTGK